MADDGLFQVEFVALIPKVQNINLKTNVSVRIYKHDKVVLIHAKMNVSVLGLFYT